MASTDALKLYGPAVANLAVTVAAYFHLRSQINGLKAPPPCGCNQDAILERLDKIEEALKRIYPAVQAHDQFIRNHPPLGAPDGVSEVPPAPTEDQKDTRTTGKTTNKASPKAKAAPKAAAKTKAPEPSATDVDLDDELDQILEGEDQANIELEATEAPSETEPPPPKAKAKAKGVPKAAAKKSFKKNN